MIVTPEFDVIVTGFDFVEAPRVDALGRIWFSDLTGGGLYRVTPGGATETMIADRLWIGGAVLDHSGALICGGKAGLVRLDPKTRAVSPLLEAIDGVSIIAVNDIEADGRGGLFGGTIDFGAVFERGEAPRGGQLFHLSPNGEVRVLREALTASNGLGFSPDGSTLYHSESTAGIWAYRLDSDGMPGDARLFAALDDSDGLVVDQAGGVWVACWASARILRFLPDGQLEREIRLPFPHLVSLAFGLLDPTDLYVSTGGNADHPGMGGIVRIKSPVPGMAAGLTRFGA